MSTYVTVLEYWNGYGDVRPGGEKLAPSVSVKDRSLSGPVIEFE